MIMTTPGSAGPSGSTVARVLLEIGAVLMRPKDPFILTSGRASPVYVDCRKVIGFPRCSTSFSRMRIPRRRQRSSKSVMVQWCTFGVSYHS